MEKQNNVPKLRFPEFSDGWEVKKLGDVIDFKVTNSFPRDNLNYDNGTIKNIHYGDIHTKFQTLFDITKELIPFINEDISINRISEDFYCKEGDIVFADASEDLNDVGKSIEIINLNNERLLSGLHTLLSRPKENTFSKGFGGYLFKSNFVRLQIQKESQGSKVLSINVGRISNIILSFPSLPEQKKIATFLSTVDEKIQALKKKKSLLETYKKGVMQKLFSQKIRFKDGEGNDYDDWEVKKLGEISENIMYGMNSSAIPFDGYNKYIRITDIDENSRTFKPNPLTSPDGDIEEKYKLKEGDIVFTRTGASVGKSYLYNPKDGNLLFAGFLIKFSIRYNNPYFIFSQTLLTSYNNWVQSMSMRSGQPGINAEEYKDLQLMIPTVPEQTKIANFLMAIDGKINKVNAQIKQTELWKKGLLQQMFV